ncbi:MAG: 16S rRNA (guanine(527)-N(7))-methyltransferase RsmG [Polyangiales bacterium]
MTLREAVGKVLAWPLPGAKVPEGEAEVEALAAKVHAVDPKTAHDQLAGWLELVKTWNRKIDLTAAKTDDDLAELGVLDAFQIAGRIARDGGGIVDVGSGFGAPGMAVAILRPDLEVKLVEPLGKRATFLRHVIGSLGLGARVEVLETRGEAVADAGMTFDTAISRATLSPAAWVELGARLAPEGEVVALLARDPIPEIPGRAVAWKVDYQTRAGAPRLAIALGPVRPPPADVA